MHSSLQESFSEQRPTAKDYSERRVIQPELSGLCKSADFSAQLLFVYLLGVSVPNVQRAFCGV
jgi:hypothetical protein